MNIITLKSIFISAFLLLLSGCLASVPTYTGDMSAVPKNLTQIDQDTAKGKMNMGLPAGWERTKAPTHASNWAAEITASFAKSVSGGKAIFTTTCYTSFISKNGIAEALRSALDPKAVKVLGPNKVDGPTLLDPEFEVYDFDAISSGRSFAMTALTAWKLDSSIGGCKYGIQMFGPRSAKQTMINDLVAILLSLQ